MLRNMLECVSSLTMNGVRYEENFPGHIAFKKTGETWPYLKWTRIPIQQEVAFYI